MSMNCTNRTGVSSAAAAVVALMVVAWPVASHAQHGHGHGHSGGGSVSGGHASSGGHVMGQARSFGGDRGSRAGASRSFGFRASDGRHRHFRHRRNGVAFGFFGDDYGYGYTSSCEYYRQRALQTGRGYWWRRYRDCIED